MEMDLPIPQTSKVVEKIIRSRGGRLSAREEQAVGESAYQAYGKTDGYPMMAFELTVYMGEGEGLTVQSHGIMYPDLKKPKWKNYQGYEYITFVHAGEACTLRGHGLFEMYRAMLDGTLQFATEFEPSVHKPRAQGEPIIDRVQITDVTEMVRKSREDRMGRNRPAN